MSPANSPVNPYNYAQKQAIAVVLSAGLALRPQLAPLFSGLNLSPFSAYSAFLR
jgi:hypothetical protein